jgi:HPt (histidine-containing phosphotransfer) domain-containing protein
LTVPLDLSRYLDLYVAESREHLCAAREIAARLPDAGDAGVLELYRHAHSLKGMAAAMGYARVAEISHAAEDLLDAVRRGQVPAHRARASHAWSSEWRAARLPTTPPRSGARAACAAVRRALGRRSGRRPPFPIRFRPARSSARGGWTSSCRTPVPTPGTWERSWVPSDAWAR